ncbi:MAG: hypothetical protein ABXS91_07885 [Sulfurimonas sp.]
MKKSVNRLIAVMIVLLGITACSTNRMSVEAKEKMNNQTGFQVENVHVELVKNPFFPEDEKHALYMNTTELAKLLKSSLKTELRSGALDCKRKKRCLHVDVNVDYMRTFVLGSNTLDTPKIGFEVDIKDQNKVIHTEKASELILSRGTLTNILTQTNIGSDKVDREREVLDFRGIAKEIVKRLSDLVR